MIKQIIIAASIILFCASSQAICSWTEQNCSADGICYNQGTANCRNYSCAYLAEPNGKLTIYNDENDVVATGSFDMSKSAADNCTAAHQTLGW